MIARLIVALNSTGAIVLAIGSIVITSVAAMQAFYVVMSMIKGTYKAGSNYVGRGRR